MDNQLSASALIVERLREKMPEIPGAHIRPAISLDWAIKNALSPSVHVVFFDDVPDTQNQRGKIQASNQLWLVVISYKNVTDAGTLARQDAGPALKKVLATLLGWKPSPEHGEIHWQKCPYRATDIGGAVHMPMLFSTKIMSSGES